MLSSQGLQLQAFQALIFRACRSLDAQMQVVSLGTHIVDHSLAGPMLLMEVMPQLLGRRSFPPPVTQEMIEPGFRDSPDPAHHMALVFTRVRSSIALAAERKHDLCSHG